MVVEHSRDKDKGYPPSTFFLNQVPLAISSLVIASLYWEKSSTDVLSSGALTEASPLAPPTISEPEEAGER